MFVVIFKARARALDADYRATAVRLRQLAFEHYGCLGFESVTEGEHEIALSYWRSEDDIRAWKAAAEHLAAQRKGGSDWYACWTVEVARIERRYQAAAGEDLEVRAATVRAIRGTEPGRDDPSVHGVIEQAFRARVNAVPPPPAPRISTR